MKFTAATIIAILSCMTQDTNAIKLAKTMKHKHAQKDMAIPDDIKLPTDDEHSHRYDLEPFIPSQKKLAVVDYGMNLAQTETSWDLQVCPAGTFEVGGACEICPAGFMSFQDSQACIICPVDFFSEAGSAECTQCPSGFSSTTGSAACSSNELYNDSTDPTEWCAPGKYDYAGECFDCPAGFYAPFGSTACHECPPNFFSSPGSVDCERCPEGYSTNDKGAQSACVKDNQDELAQVSSNTDNISQEEIDALLAQIAATVDKEAIRKAMDAIKIVLDEKQDQEEYEQTLTQASVDDLSQKHKAELKVASSMK